MKTPGNADARSGLTQTLIKPSEAASKVTIKATRDTVSNEAERRHALIAEAAYLLAERRHFEAGHDVEDWLAAELALNLTRPAAVATSL